MSRANDPRSFINRIETACPSHEGHAKFLAFLPQLVRDQKSLKLIQRLASKSQIERRYTVLAPSENVHELDNESFYQPGAFATTGRRMRKYQAEALPLALQAASRVLADVERASVTHLILTSCTGFYAPGLDLELQRSLGLRSDLERTIVGFMGCHAAVSALKLADHIVRANHNARVLMVNVELCSLHLQDFKDETESIEEQARRLLGFLQFADGCAATLISADEQGLEIERFHCETLGEHADQIRWAIGDEGFIMHLSLDVPKTLGERLPEVLPRLLSGEERAQTKLWAIHPGGRSILDAVAERLELTPSEMMTSRQVLRDYGNMSSATIMFVLRAIMNDSAQSGAGQALAFGPGLTVESMRFHKAMV